MSYILNALVPKAYQSSPLAFHLKINYRQWLAEVKKLEIKGLSVRFLETKYNIVFWI